MGATVLLHNVHRNARAPEWFTGSMAVTNSFVHEIDISRWLTGSEMVSAHVAAGPGGDPLMITMRTDRDEIISTEVFMNAAYGYHVHAELVGRSGTVALAPPSLTLRNRDGAGGHSYPENWVPRFADAYRRQMVEWVRSVKSGTPVGASAWDGYVASAIAEQIAAALSRSLRGDPDIRAASSAVRTEQARQGDDFIPSQRGELGREFMINYAVVGAGWISQEAFLPGIGQSGNSRVAAIVTGDRAKAEATRGLSWRRHCDRL